MNGGNKKGMFNERSVELDAKVEQQLKTPRTKLNNRTDTKKTEDTKVFLIFFLSFFLSSFDEVEETAEKHLINLLTAKARLADGNSRVFLLFYFFSSLQT